MKRSRRRPHHNGSRALLAALLAFLSPGCRKDAPPLAKDSIPPGGLFEDVTEKAGIRFRHDNGFAEKFYFVESNPAGCAFLDFDNDGDLDIFLVQSGPSEPPETVKNRPRCALYKNDGQGRYTDVTAGSGLDKDLGYGYGIAVGDYNNDGFSDMFVTAYGAVHLFQNERGAGTFADVTEKTGLSRPHSSGFATSAAFGDLDNDGDLDLYVCYYSSWTWKLDKTCMDSKGDSEYCTPEIYEPDTHRLFRNDRAAGFVDTSDRSGIGKKKGRGFAAAFIDYDGDGKQDIFVANDMTPNFLWHNRGQGRFEEVALEAGCAYNADGSIIAGMGVAVGDYDHSGRESLYVTDFSNKVNPLFHLGPDSLFTDRGRMAGRDLMTTSRFLSFGTSFLDFDADGWLDLAVNNGHVNFHIDRSPGGVTYRERKQLFKNEGGKFAEITGDALGPLAAPRVGRGLAVGDYDNDGRVDLLAMNQNDPVQLLRNRDAGKNHWVSFLPIGTKSNRDGVHAAFRLEAGGVKQFATVRGGSSYLSASDRRVYFGLGAATTIPRVEIRWPSGQKDILTNVRCNAIHTVTEGRGITHTTPPTRP